MKASKKHISKIDTADDFNPMNIDDPVFIKQGLDYLNKGIIAGKVVGVTYELGTHSQVETGAVTLK